MDNFSPLTKALECKLILNSSNKTIETRRSCGEILKEKQFNIISQN